jgi:hypothetical protein
MIFQQASLCLLAFYQGRRLESYCSWPEHVESLPNICLAALCFALWMGSKYLNLPLTSEGEHKYNTQGSPLPVLVNKWCN